MFVKYYCTRCGKRIRWWQTAVWDERVERVKIDNKQFETFRYKEHMKHKSCLTSVERKQLELDKRKSSKKRDSGVDDSTSNLVT